MGVWRGLRRPWKGPEEASKEGMLWRRHCRGLRGSSKGPGYSQSHGGWGGGRMGGRGHGDMMSDRVLWARAGVWGFIPGGTGNRQGVQAEEFPSRLKGSPGTGKGSGQESS